MTTMTNSEKLLSYIESAKAALKEVIPDIGHGKDPLGFIICSFVAQSEMIKEKIGIIDHLNKKHTTVQAKWSHERMCLKDAIFRNERRIKELKETIENEACRFNCRTQKVAFKAGYTSARFPGMDRNTSESAYKAWKENSK